MHQTVSFSLALRHFRSSSFGMVAFCVAWCCLNMFCQANFQIPYVPALQAREILKPFSRATVLPLPGILGIPERYSANLIFFLAWNEINTVPR